MLRNKVAYMIRATVDERLLIDVGYTLPETHTPARLGKPGRQTVDDHLQPE